MLDLVKDFVVQAKDPTRASLVPCERTGGQALRLHTEPGDDHIVGSGDMRRCDKYQCIRGTENPVLYLDGTSKFYAHSVWFPPDFQEPAGNVYNVFDFHGYPDTLGPAANFHLCFSHWNSDPTGLRLGQLQFLRFWGDPSNPKWSTVILGKIVRERWYDFVYYVRWSSHDDGFFRAWLDGKLVMAHTGPTLYVGGSVYMKLANYHSPLPDTPASSVIHDRVRVGTTWASVTS